MKIVFFISLTFLLLTGCKSKKEQENVIPVDVEKAEAELITLSEEYSGMVAASHISNLSFKESGYVKEVFVTENQWIKKGQILAILDDAILKANYNSAHAIKIQAEDAYNRMRALYLSKSLPEIKWVETKSAYEQALAREKITKEKLSNLLLLAPSNGFVTSRMVEPGMNISAGTPVLTIMEGDNIKIQVSIPENDISKILIGQKCYLKFSSLEDKTFIGFVRNKSRISDPVSHTYIVNVSIDKHANVDILPGMTCEVKFMIKNGINRQIVLSPTAIQIKGKDKFVWIIKDKKPIMKKVSLGRYFQDKIIVHGLNEGDTIIVNGGQKLNSSTKISLRWRTRVE